ncbi:MAG TPA: GNAT family N-acetyltransferase [Caulobacteraceae bacterium]|nr:GNAT family N-acetyltransferase [Caulobacteraceae bacterium]
MAEIRPYEAADLEDLYRICLATGDSGADASPLYADAKLIGELYAAPYGIFSPHTCFTAKDEHGIGGYILGALDTPVFEDLLEHRWWPALRARHADPRTKPRESWIADDTLALRIHRPYRTPERISQPFPSHLHIDLLPRLQGCGLGRRMMDVWLAKVRALGSKGAHLGVSLGNVRARRFYAAYGWRELEVGPDALWLGLDL